MIALLDPALFLPRANRLIQHDFDLIVYLCRKHAVQLPPLEEYWRPLWSGPGRSLEKQVPPEIKATIREVQRIAKKPSPTIPKLPSDPGTIWRRGFAQLFDLSRFGGANWEQPMAEAALRATCSGQAVIVITRRMKNRNIRVHAAEQSRFQEPTRWALYVQPRNIGPKRIHCVHHPRNLMDDWTIRFDWRLPGPGKGGTHPFCYPDKWWQAGTTACGTVRSKPAWLDRFGNGWARPNISQGAGYHWDVYIENKSQKQLAGADHVNVVAFGVPKKQGQPGNIHHPPEDIGKRGRWRC